MSADLTTPIGVLKALLTNPLIALGDLVYLVREREGMGWDGPFVKDWSDAVSAAQKLLVEHEEKSA